MDCLAFLARSPKGQPEPIYVLAGDEDFLKRRASTVLTSWVLGGEDGYGLSEYPGETAEWAAVRDELSTLPFFGPHRLIVIENADPFVTRFRAQLEKYVASPAMAGVLVLEVKSWPSTTRLAKQLASTTISCKAPAAARVPAWCAEWVKSEHGKQLTTAAAQLLVDLVGTDMGLLDQELAKLAVYIGKAARIDVEDVDRLVGRGQTANVFKVFDAIGSGQPAEALAILDQLLTSGEEPFRVMAAFSLQLRRLAQAASLASQGATLADAFDRAGIPAWPAARQSCEQQLRHLGGHRAGQLFDWLLEVDLGMKGSSSLPPRTLLERLLVRMAEPQPRDMRRG
jgi:DNA polymerase-3 subunit delta